MKIGFALVTEDSFLKDVVQIVNEKSAEFAFLNTLGVQNNLPHTTIFQGNFCDDFDYRQSADDIALSCLNLGIRELEFTNVGYESQGWYFWFCRKTDKLQFLHNKTLDDIKDAVLLDPDRMKQCMDGIPPYQQGNICLYGYRYARSAFRPHITLGRTDGNTEHREIIASLENEMKYIPNKARIARVTVYRMGDNGTHAETLDEVHLIQ